MIVKLNKRISSNQVNDIIDEIEKLNIKVLNKSNKEEYILQIDCTKEQIDKISKIKFVDCVIESPIYKHVSHIFDDVVVKLSNCTFSRKHFTIIAGPCSVESNVQMNSIVEDIKSNVHVIRGGAYKPRTSPYDFQGLAKDGLEILKNINSKYNIPIITEITSIEDIDYFVNNVDIIQVGARNMQNFDLLKRLGKVNKPVLLKRGLSNTVNEWILASEYIVSNGNKEVILCERGIRTFEDKTRNTLDLSAVVLAKELTNLPVVVDPSHACGKAWMIEKLALASLAVGADGIMIEVHNDPANALSDGEQSITPNTFNDIVSKLKTLAPSFNKKVE